MQKEQIDKEINKKIIEFTFVGILLALILKYFGYFTIIAESMVTGSLTIFAVRFFIPFLAGLIIGERDGYILFSLGVLGAFFSGLIYALFPYDPAALNDVQMTANIIIRGIIVYGLTGYIVYRYMYKK